METTVEKLSEACKAALSFFERAPIDELEAVEKALGELAPTQVLSEAIAEHERQWHGIASQTERCNHCRCSFRLILFNKGQDYQNLSWKLFCPFCATLFDSQMGFE